MKCKNRNFQIYFSLKLKHYVLQPKKGSDKFKKDGFNLLNPGA